MNSKVHHAENMLIINNAQFLREFASECTLYTTAEPCLMCIGTIAMADIKNIVVGTEDPHMATKDLIKNHKWLNMSISNYITGVKKDACRDLILNYCDEKTITRLLGSR